MEHLEIKGGPMKAIRTGIAILNVVAGIAAFISSLESGHILLKISAAFIVLFGLYLLTNGFGFERCWIKSDDEGLIIKWTNRISAVKIHNSRIFKVSIERTRVMIYRKELKPMKLDISYFEKNQKTEVYNFFIEFCRKNNIVLEKHSSTLL